MEKPQMPRFDLGDIARHRSFESLGGAAGEDALVFVVAQPDLDADRYQTTLWFLRPGTRQPPRRLTSPLHDARSPSLSPDASTVAFISDRDSQAGPQLHLIDIDGGEARALTRLDCKPKKIQQWSHDGQALLLTARVPWAEDELDDPKAGNSRPVVADFLPYKFDGVGPTVGYRTQLLRIDAHDGAPRTLLGGDYDVEEAQWSPDGRRLAFVRNRTGRERHFTDLWIANADGGSARRITEDIAQVGGVRWSPDGRLLAFSGTRREGDSYSTLWIHELATGRTWRPAGNRLQLEGQWLVWHPASARIATLAARRGVHQVAIVNVVDGHVEAHAPGLGHVHDLCASEGRLCYVYASVRKLDEMYSIDWEGADRRRHTSMNRWFLDRPRPRTLKRRFAVPDGNGGSERIDAWVMLPPDAKPPFPLLVDMHGGPQSVTLIDFAEHTYWYELCQQGWAVVSPNAVGSGSYGPKFARRLCGRWGELDLPQYLAVIRTLQEEGFADHRVACTGSSYGGYLSAWAVGNSQRFTSAVVRSPVINIESHYGTSDSGYYVTPYAMAGEVTQAHERYHRLSPVRHCADISVPVLLLQGEDDGRCPVGQSEELFATLVRCGRAPCRLVVYPEGTHGVGRSGKPSHRLDYHRRLARWVQEWTAEEAAAQPAGGQREQEHQPEH
jgi:dipeptidyl aminopeptidase/acylaminoacyl peptidase